MPLALKPPRRPRFDNFVAGDNGSVVATLRDGLETGQWYFLRGSAGTGRTHLLAATLWACSAAGRSAQFIALADPRQRELLEQACAEVLLVDDIDVLAGHAAREKALFNALNQWRAERCTVVMSGQGRERFELPDLRSRLGQATRLNLAPLGETDLTELILRLAREHEVLLGRGVVDYLLSRAPRNAGQLAGLVEELARRALTERRTVSIPLAREVLSEG